MKSSLKKINSEFDVIAKEKAKKFVLNISENEKLLIYDQELIEKIINSNFNQKYRKLLRIVMDITESEDASDSDVEIALIKIEDLKNLLLSKYYKYISRDLLNKYLKMLILIEEKLNTSKRCHRR